MTRRMSECYEDIQFSASTRLGAATCFYDTNRRCDLIRFNLPEIVEYLEVLRRSDLILG